MGTVIVPLPSPVVIAGRSYSNMSITSAATVTTPTVVATITGATNASPIVLTLTPVPGMGGLQAFPIAAQVTIAGVLGNTAANGVWPMQAPTGQIATADAGTPITITSTTPHGLATGMNVTIAGCSNPIANGSFVITVTGASTFTLSGTGGVTPGTGGTWIANGVFVLVGSVGNGAYTGGGTVTMPVATNTGQKAYLVPDTAQ